MAPVKAPRTCPNRVDSSRSAGMELLLTAMDGWVAGGGSAGGRGDQFLARAGFAGDQDGGAAGCNLGDKVQNSEHPVAFSNDVGKGVALLESALKLPVLGFETALGDH